MVNEASAHVLAGDGREIVKLALAAVGYAEKGLFSSLLASTFGDRFGRMRKKV